MVVVKRAKLFATEADLCACFIAAIGPGWVSYAESCGWDILLVRKADGFQIGIEAKLKLNLLVVAQALEDGRPYAAESPGPDCRAVLVPDEGVGALDLIAGYIGFTIIRVHAPGGWQGTFSPPLPKAEGRGGFGAEGWFECGPAARHVLPDYVPDVVAGSPSPVQLTAWKIAAIKMSITLDQRGYVTRADFKAHGIDYRRWIAREYGWLIANDGRYTVGPRFPDFKLQHPRVYLEIAADASKWMPVDNNPPPAPQESMI